VTVPPRVARLDELPRLQQGNGVIWRPIRRTLDLRGVSANAYTGAAAGDEVIEPHDELSPSAAGHEELYLVTSGRATFTVDGEEVDALPGTLIAIGPGSQRHAVAAEPETTVVVVGGMPGAAYPPAPFEYWYAAEPHYVAGDYERGIEVLREGLEHHPRAPGLNYQLACYLSLAGRGDEAVEHLRIALDGPEERVAGWAVADEDLDSIRGRDDFPDLTG
jgi:mannose-6-phosphate isomerase-like protein (cupin superfamily)